METTFNSQKLDKGPPLNVAIGIALCFAFVVLITLLESEAVIAGGVRMSNNLIILGSLLAAGSTIAIPLIHMVKGFQRVLLMLLFGCVAALAGMLMTTIVVLNQNHQEIRQHEYAAIAETLRNRAELDPFLKDARTDEIITRQERGEFLDAIDQSDRRKVLGR